MGPHDGRVKAEGALTAADKVRRGRARDLPALGGLSFPAPHSSLCCTPASLAFLRVFQACFLLRALAAHVANPWGGLSNGPPEMSMSSATQPVDVTLRGKQQFAGVIKLRLFRGGGDFGLFRWVQCTDRES